MKIVFKFNSKSSGQDVPEAIRIAENCGGILENKFYKIEFSSPEDKDLRKLFDLVGRLKGTAIMINDEEPIVARKFFDAVNCSEKFLCKGICKHVRIGFYDLDDFLKLNSGNINKGVLTISDESLIRYISDFIETIGENRFKFNKELFLEYFHENTKLEERFCNKYNFNKILKEIEKLPTEIELIPREEVSYEMEYEEDFETEDMIRTILTHCELSSKMSFKDMLDCSKAMGLLINERGCVRIEDTDIMIYTFPIINQIILIKIILDETEEEDSELKFIALKEKEFFCASNPYSRLYFQLFDADDSALEEYFKKLKSLK